MLQIEEEYFEEGNIVIAEFMGRKFKAYNHNSSFNEEFATYQECMEFIQENKYKGYKPELYWEGRCGQYHKDWNWLMEVIDKIEVSSIDDHTLPTVTISTKHIEIAHDKPPILYKRYIGRLESTWHAVVEYIRWYNDCKKNQES